MYKDKNSIIISKENKNINGEITLPSSKSICNRILIIQSICKDQFEILNISDADDSQLLTSLLNDIHNSDSNSSPIIIDAKNAGTVFRFLAAYLSVCEGKYILTGDERMLQRPVNSLVDGLINLGADINFVDKPGFPPLQIGDFNYITKDITIEGSLSSQFITALLLIAPLLPDGLTIKLIGDIVSLPYIKMSLKLMEQFNVKYDWSNNIISIPKQDYSTNINHFTIEADWSAASYFYQIVAMADNADIFIKDLKKDSLQGDAIVADIFKSFGVDTVYEDGGVRLTNNGIIVDEFQYDFSNYPDLFPAVAVTCAALGINAELKGLRNLKIKESDRLTAMVIELNKMNVKTFVENDEVLWIDKSDIRIYEPLETYNDHRMAMCFAPLALLNKKIEIINPQVVAKSFPDYFKELLKIGFVINI